MAIRNPRSHERTEDSQKDAEALIVFIDYLLRVIGHARSAFSIDDCVRRIVEESFVPNERYAALLVNDIPSRQRLQVALTVLQRKSEGDGRKLKFFFDALLQVLTQQEKNELFEAVSSELKDSSDELSPRCVLQMLAPENWVELDEAARIRSEYRLIANLQDGRYLERTRKCLSGGMATWCTGFLKHFTLKWEVYSAIVQKLRSSSTESQDYALRFFWPYLDQLSDKPTSTLQSLLAERLCAGDSRFKDAAEWPAPWGGELWSDEVKAALTKFEAVTPATSDLDDDIPF